MDRRERTITPLRIAVKATPGEKEPVSGFAGEGVNSADP